jgi:hypothetical protein
MLKNERAVIGNNGMSRDEFLRQVLYSGEVTKIAQHLALVLFLVSEGKNRIDITVREIEDITGWGKSTIRDHISELEVFMKVTLGVGRSKTFFELQGVIEDAIANAVVSGSRTQIGNSKARQPDTNDVQPQPDTIPDTTRNKNAENRQPDTTPDTNAVHREPDSKPDTNRNADAPKTRAYKDITTTNSNNNKPTTSETVTPPVSSVEDDLTEQMIDDICGWMNISQITERARARKWLGTTVQTYGDGPTRSAYHQLKTRQFEREVVAKGKEFCNSYATFAAIKHFTRQDVEEGRYRDRRSVRVSSAKDSPPI